VLRAFTPDSLDVALDSPVPSLHQCHLELAVGLQFPGAPDSLVCGIGQSGEPPESPVPLPRQSAWQHLSSFLGLHLIFIMSSFEVLLSSMP
jgi:hypothetical protein